MLQLIMGAAGTGKTAWILKQMGCRAKAGQKSVLVVPEQFSSTAEGMCYRALGDEAGPWAHVYSFKSLAEKILKTAGGITQRTLTDAGRCVAVRRAVDSLAGQLTYYRTQKRQVAFASVCADAIKELKIAGACPADVEKAAALAGSGQSGAKLRDLSLIYAAYEAVIAGVALEPADRVTLAARSSGHSLFEDTVFYIDDFDGFTAPEYALIQRLLEGAEGCVVALSTDSLTDNEGGLGLFSTVKKTARRLLALAEQCGCPVLKSQRLDRPLRYRTAGTLALARHLAGGQPGEEGEPQAESHLPEPPAGAVTLTPVCSRDLEAQLAAAACRRLAAKGMEYRQMVIICRDMAPYEAPLRRALELCGVPAFFDQSVTVEHTAPAVFVRSVLRLAYGGTTTENLLRTLKTGLCGANESRLSRLENYAYTWQMKAADWQAPFTRNPSGFAPQWTPEDTALLEELEEARVNLIAPLTDFARWAKKQPVAAVCRRIYLLMEHCGAPQCLEQLAARLEGQCDCEQSEQLRRAWDITMDLLDQLTALCGEETLSPQELDSLFLQLVRGTDMGRVPETLDCVTVSCADRMRPGSPACAFVLGLCEGQFPAAVGYSGVLTHADRELLVEGGVQMPGSFESRTLLEEMFFYRALTCASQQVYLSYPLSEGGPEGVSAPVAYAREALGLKPLPFAPWELAVTPAAALDLLSESYRADPVLAASLCQVLRDRPVDGPGGVPILDSMEHVAGQTGFAVRDKRVMERLLGAGLRLSPSRIERYYTCRFAYFLEYVLKIKPLRPAEISPIESGSFVHYILEKALRESADSFTAMSGEEIARLAERIARQYIEEKMAGADSSRFHFLIERIVKSTVSLLLFIQQDMQQSSFSPVDFELPIGAGQVPALHLETPDGHRVDVVGTVDRVDVMERDGRSYIRVVDYKTGNKTFSLPEVYNGLKTQMLVYLFTLCKNGGGLYRNPMPAGVLYLLGDASPGVHSREESHKPPVFKVDGLLVEDEMLLRAMDHTGSGVFIPVKEKKAGGYTGKDKLASLEKLGRIETRVTELMVQMAARLYAGDIEARPLVDKNSTPCTWCDYRSVCRHEDGCGEQPLLAPDHPFEGDDPGEQPRA